MTLPPLFDPVSGRQVEVLTARPAPEAFDFNARLGERYTMGVDLGQSQDFTAICIVRRVEEEGAKPVFQVGHLQRLPLGTTYPTVVAHVIDLMSRARLRGKTELVIDFTGVGRPVYDLFRVHGVSPVGVAITAGSAITRDGTIWHVPKGHLVSRVQALLHTGQLKIHADLPDVSTLLQELQDFRVSFTETGYATFNARSGKHDDLVLALAIALWHSHGEPSGFDNWMQFIKNVNGGAWKTKQPAPSAMVTLKRPNDGISQVVTLTGRTLNVSAEGMVEVSEEDARPLRQAGWQSVEAQP